MGTIRLDAMQAKLQDRDARQRLPGVSGAPTVQQRRDGGLPRWASDGALAVTVPIGEGLERRVGL
jgi:hypothetical protein